MRKSAVAFLLLSSVLLSCSKERQPAPSNAADVSGMNGTQASTGRMFLPEVVSAVLSPLKATSNTPLFVQYDLHAPDKELIKCRFRWYVNGTVVQDGPESTLAPGTYTKGSLVFVEIIPSANDLVGKPFKTAGKDIGNLPPSIISVDMKPAEPAAGDTITAAPTGMDPDGDAVAYLYQWTVNDQPVTDVVPDQNTFSTKGLKKKDVVVVVVTPADGESTGVKKLSTDIVIVNSSPRILSTPLTKVENGAYEYQVVAKDSDGDALSYALVTSPVGMTIDRATGLIRWDPPKKVPPKTEVPVKIFVDDGDGGSTIQEYSLLVETR